MELSEKAIKEVIDLFDITYAEDEETSSKEGMPEHFSELEGDISSDISNMEEKGEALETVEETVEVEVEQTEKTETEERDLETIEDLIATSVEEAKALTTVQEEAVAEEEFEAMVVDDTKEVEVDAFQKDLNEIILEKEAKDKAEEDFDAIVIQPDVVDANGDVVTDEVIEDLQKQLSEVANDPNLIINSNSHAFLSEKVESPPVALEDENVDVIPCKDSEGFVKGEIRMKDITSVAYDRKGNPIVSGGEILWNTVSPTELYDEFYAIKTEHINKFSGGEQLDFAKLYSDLFGAKVDTSTEVLDQGVLTHKMDEVMHCVERVAMIQVQINQQHFVWKRFVELLRGALARVSYLKPVLKQDGLILEHMGDVEFYADRLAAIKDSADKVMKTLQMAFESLSRKVSIMLTVQSKHTIRMSPDAYSGSSQTTYEAPAPVEARQIAAPPAAEVAETPVVSTQDLSDYDDFKMGTEVNSTKAKSGTVGWGEVW
jgi:hypothetical protein